MEQRGEEVPEAIKEERLQILNDVITAQSARCIQPYLNQTVEVLVEGKSRRNESRLMGRTRNNKVVNFDSPFEEEDMVGQLVQVDVDEVYPWSLLGHQVLKEAEIARFKNTTPSLLTT
jgi:tRNA-2-methylthio-N6-dimethylallyladenosine synthase